MRAFKISTLLLSLTVLLAACSTPMESAKIEDRTGKDNVADNRGVKPTDSGDSTDPLGKDAASLKRSVYFDFDSYVIRADGQPVVEANAKYLAGHKNLKVVIQGNTDERGGREYNLALGQKRSEAVRKAMSLLGVPESQMEAVSFGKEKPKATGSDEASWAENRRADIVYHQ